MELEEVVHVFLKITPTTRVGRSRKSQKLNARYIGRFPITKRIGLVVHQIALSLKLSNLHPVFHVSQLRKCILNPSHIIVEESVQVTPNLKYVPKLARIVDIDLKKKKTLAE